MIEREDAESGAASGRMSVGVAHRGSMPNLTRVIF